MTSSRAAQITKTKTAAKIPARAATFAAPKAVDAAETLPLLVVRLCDDGRYDFAIINLITK